MSKSDVTRLGHIFVADGFNHTLKVFQRGVLVSGHEARMLRVTENNCWESFFATGLLENGNDPRKSSWRLRRCE